MASLVSYYSGLAMHANDWLQAGIGLFLISVVLIYAGLTVAWLLRNRGPVWQSMVYRSTLLSLLIALVLVIGLSGRYANRYSIVQPDITPTITSYVITSSPDTLPKISAEIAYKPGELSDAVHKERTSRGVFEIFSIFTLLIIWGIGVVFGLIGLCGGAISLRLLYNSSEIIEDDSIKTLVGHLAERLNIATPRVMISNGLDSPFLTGIWKPVIYLPEDYADQYDPPTLRAIIAHELAHHANRDCRWLYLSRMCELLFWINPLVWLLHKRLDLVSEEISDAVVVSLDCPPADYANSLLSLAERLRPTENAFAIGVVPIKSTLGKRIKAILAQSGNRLAQLSGKSKRITAIVSQCIVLLVVIALCPSGMAPVGEYPKNYADNFTLAKQMGWRIGPVYRDNSLIKINSAKQVISDEDMKLMHGRVHFTSHDELLYFIPSFLVGRPDRVQLIIKDIERKPDFFYDEYCMAVYYLQLGNMKQYRYWLQRSLKHAPVILTGRMQLDNGYPVNNYRFGLGITFDVTPNRSNNSPNIQYDIVTDDNGCYYIPCFKGYYTFSGSSYPANGGRYKGFRPIINSFGTVTTGQHAGLLPPIYLRPDIKFNGSWSTNESKPTQLDSQILNISWQRDSPETIYNYAIDGMATPGLNYNVVISPKTNLTLPINHIPIISTIDNIENIKKERNKVHSLRLYSYRGDQMYRMSPTIYFRFTQPNQPL